MSERQKTRVLVADDHHQIAQAVLRDLYRAPTLEAVGSCRSARAAEAMALVERPDVVLMDVVMPGKCPFDSCQRIVDETGGAVRVLFWTGFHREDFIHRCKAAGGSGIVSKGCETFEELVAVIERVAAGETYWSPDWEARLQELEAGGELSPIERLTPREIAVIHQLAEGLSAEEAALYMDLNIRTVRRSIQDAREKLGCRTTAQLVYKATVECVVTPTTLTEETVG